MKDVFIKTPYIKLGQLLKYANIISSGSEEKVFLLSNVVFVNDEKEQRRGRKLYIGDEVKIKDEVYKVRCESKD